MAADAACHADPAMLTKLRSDLSDARHREGIGRARHLLDLVEPLTESPLESLVRLLIVLSGLPRPQVQVPVVTASALARVDFLVGASPTSAGVVVEADGRRHHETWDAAVADRRRQNLLVERGLQV
nr:hypothetical protein [Micromonospora sp. DSM 115978]